MQMCAGPHTFTERTNKECSFQTHFTGLQWGSGVCACVHGDPLRAGWQEGEESRWSRHWIACPLSSTTQTNLTLVASTFFFSKKTPKLLVMMNMTQKAKSVTCIRYIIVHCRCDLDCALKPVSNLQNSGASSELSE